MKSNLVALTTVLVLLFIEQIVYGMFYSDLSFITQSFFPGMDKKKLGYYAGYLLSAFYLGQLPGSVFWGWLADKCGRKKPLMVIVFLDAICVLSFAFLQNYYVAVAVRFVWGFLDGHYPLVKTLATDYSTEENVALHTSFLFVSVSFGNAIAPLLGGYFSDPEHISDWLLQLFPILRTKQFCLPFLICGLLLFLCLFFVILFVTETKNDKDTLLADSPPPVSLFNTWILLAIVLYGFEALMQCSYDSLISLWLSTDRSLGGFGWDAQRIGNYLCFVCPMQAMNLVLFPVLVKACGAARTYRVIVSIQTVVLFVTPLISYCAMSTATVSALYVFMSSFHLCRVILFNSAIVLIADHSEKNNRGKLYGISQMICGSGRFIGPPCLTSLFAWSIQSSRPFPIDHCLSFFVLATVSVSNIVIAWFIPS
ncbi:zinc induced facilitator-like 2 protein [Blastocystis sp. ATCC 50177/Nand II]|uniref:Zinc induced facilitator-like 2 protein n=1 Tax=Blastocystis sp. subtype 1 (strain ATCC 50177 / NandII) TaxID=478820 RepID=A0A196SE70_BLAHN|nr:zinc induced facilitator-like 2 protein [Blastocystis sp. ATCC 50177/Nand II]